MNDAPDFRTLGAFGSYPDWLRQCYGQNGVYLIREIGGDIVYIGESHTGRLRKTITRHFQAWDGPTSGPTYDRGGVEVAVILCAANEALTLQDVLIGDWLPKDNRRRKDVDDVAALGEDLEDAPF